MAVSMERCVQYGYVPENEKARLFCFHYAGGSASFFAGWNEMLPAQLGLYPYQLAGHGTRSDEPMPDSLEAAADEAAEYIKEHSEKPFILFGHSMGGVIAYLTALRLSDCDISPERVIISAAAPDFRQLEHDTGIHMTGLDDEGFCRTLIEFGAIDKRIFRVRNFKELYLPVIRNDFRITEAYCSDPEQKVKCPISVYGGTEDIIARPEYLYKWKEFTEKDISVRMMSGEHFFIRQHLEEICSDISRAVSDII